MKNKLVTLSGCFLASLISTSASSADFQKKYISIAGSTDIAPYAKAVSDRFDKSKRLQAPLIQASGTGGGIKLFCEGLTAESPDIVATVRPMKPKEIAECKTNGVGEVIEIPIGYDAIILAQSKNAPAISLTRKQARTGAAMWLAGPDGKLIPNPNKTWKDVDPSLPQVEIDIHGPANTSGVYDAFVELVSGLECRSRPWVADPKAEPNPDVLRKCRTLRNPGIYVTDPIDSSSSISSLAASPSELGIIDYNTLVSSSAKIRAVPIDGVEPTIENISSQAYPGTQRFFIYVKASNLGATPGLKEYVTEFAGENALSEKGYLKSLGLVTLLPDQRTALREQLKSYGINPSSAVTVSTTSKSSTKATKAKSKKK
jgi:phosphate transport system substrate-binding protein